MSLLDRFRHPRWKHPDRAVRASAVDELGDHEQQTLEAIAREDEDAGVRRLATARLEDPALLAEIARTDASDEVREEARALLLDLALDEQDAARAEAAAGVLADEKDLAILAKQATTDRIGLAAVGRLSSVRALASVARRAAHPAVRLAAFARVTDADERLAVAVKTEHKDVGLAALETLDDTAALDAVAARARNKLVARRARALVRARMPAEEAAPGAPPLPDADEICRRLDEAAEASEPRLVAYRLDEADALWAQLDEPVRADPAVLARVEAARTRARARLDGLEARTAEAEARRVREAAHAELCARIQALDGDAIPAGLAEIAEAWAALDHVDVGPEPGERYARAVGDAEARYERWRATRERASELEARAADAEAIASLGDVAEMRERWSALVDAWRPLVAGVAAGHPAAAGAVARFTAAEGRVAAREAEVREAEARERQVRLDELEALCQRLEAIVGRDDLSLKDADQAWHEARAAAEGLSGPSRRHDGVQVAGRLRAVQARLFARLQEIREVDDWKRWANAGVQEEICEKVEALQQIDDIAEVAPKLRDLRQQWKQVSTGPRGEEGSTLWQRFRAAVDQVQARCDVYFAERAVEEQQRIAVKRGLCERAEALADSTDWLRTAEELKQLQLEWQGLGSIKGEQARELAVRFRTACDRFFTRRKEDLAQRKAVWSVNQGKKEALIAQAETVAETTNWQEGLETLKRLQVEWRGTGPVKRQKSELLWKRFRAACDRFFERYKNRHRLEIDTATDAREQLITELERLIAPAAEAAAEGAGPGDVAAASDEGTGPPPAQSLDDGAVEARAAAAEPVVPLEGHQGEVDGGKVESERDDGQRPDEAVSVKAHVEDIWARWRAAPPLPGGMQNMLEGRFAAVYRRVIDAHPALFRGTALDPRENLKRMEGLCQQVEGVLNQIGVQPLKGAPAGTLASMLKEALAANTIGGRADDQTRRRAALDTVRSAQAEWRGLGPAPGENGRALMIRFSRACRRFFDHQARAASGGAGHRAGGGPDAGGRRKGAGPRPHGNGRNQETGGAAAARPAQSAPSLASSVEPPAQGAGTAPSRPGGPPRDDG